MVKGTSRRVIVVESPDPEYFEQAIFIVRNDVYERKGVTAQQVLGEACRIAKGYAAATAEKRPAAAMSMQTARADRPVRRICLIRDMLPAVQAVFCIFSRGQAST